MRPTRLDVLPAPAPASTNRLRSSSVRIRIAIGLVGLVGSSWSTACVAWVVVGRRTTARAAGRAACAPTRRTARRCRASRARSSWHSTRNWNLRLGRRWPGTSRPRCPTRRAAGRRRPWPTPRRRTRSRSAGSRRLPKNEYSARTGSSRMSAGLGTRSRPRRRRRRAAGTGAARTVGSARSILLYVRGRADLVVGDDETRWRVRSMRSTLP